MKAEIQALINIAMAIVDSNNNAYHSIDRINNFVIVANKLYTEYYSQFPPIEMVIALRYYSTGYDINEDYYTQIERSIALFETIFDSIDRIMPIQVSKALVIKYIRTVNTLYTEVFDSEEYNIFHDVILSDYGLDDYEKYQYAAMSLRHEYMFDDADWHKTRKHTISALKTCTGGNIFKSKIGVQLLKQNAIANIEQENQCTNTFTG